MTEWGIGSVAECWCSWWMERCMVYISMLSEEQQRWESSVSCCGSSRWICTWDKMTLNIHKMVSIQYQFPDLHTIVKYNVFLGKLSGRLHVLIIVLKCRIQIFKNEKIKVKMLNLIIERSLMGLTNFTVSLAASYQKMVSLIEEVQKTTHCKKAWFNGVLAEKYSIKCKICWQVMQKQEVFFFKL